MYNSHGLSRSIPPKIKRSVRQRCAFGCVICGNGIYEYEHFNPEFKDCTRHSPDGITLLCMQCHGKKERGFLSKETVERANKNPFAKKRGFWENFDFGNIHPTVFLGNNKFADCPNIILVEKQSILKIDPPEEKDSPYRLSGIFYDETGEKVLEINKNEWRGNPELWDVETKAGKIIIKTDGVKVKTVLDFSVKRMPDQVEILQLDMQYKGHKFLISDGVFKHIQPSGSCLRLERCKSNAGLSQIWKI